MNIERRLSSSSVMGWRVQPAPVFRGDQLRGGLVATVDSLARGRADLIAEGFLEDYVALHWLEWSSGALRLTESGADLCARMRAELM